MTKKMQCNALKPQNFQNPTFYEQLKNRIKENQQCPKLRKILKDTKSEIKISNPTKKTNQQQRSNEYFTSIQSENKKSIKFTKQQITDVQADAIVNICGLKNDKVNSQSQLIMNKAGEQYQNYMKNLNNPLNDLQYGDIAQTQNHNLPYTNTIINVPAQYIQVQKPGSQDQVISGSNIYQKSSVDIQNSQFNQKLQNFTQQNQTQNSNISSVINTILSNASSSNMQSIAIPVFSNGQGGQYDQNSIIEMTTCVQEYLNSNDTSLQTVIFVEDNKNNIDKYILPSLKDISKDAFTIIQEPDFSFKWKNDDGNFYEYQSNVNSKINQLRKQYEKSKKEYQLDVEFPPSFVIPKGTHEVDLNTMQATDLNISQNSFKIKYQQGKYWNADTNQQLQDKVSEYIDIQKQNGYMKFPIFMKYYTIVIKQDGSMFQINKQTKFERQIQMQTVSNGEKQKYQQIINRIKNAFNSQKVKIITDSTSQQLNNTVQTDNTNQQSQQQDSEIQDTEQLILNSLNSQDCLDQLKELLEEQAITESIIIPNNIDKPKVKNIIKLMKRADSSYQNEDIFKNPRSDDILKLRGQKYELKGFRREINEVKREIQRPENSLDIEYPQEWENQGAPVQLFDVDPNKHRQEYSKVVNHFQKTSASPKQIVKVQRIQNKYGYASYMLAIKKTMTLLQNVLQFSNQNDENLQTIEKEFKGKQYLWHGTSSTDPSIIYKGEFDIFDSDFGNAGCMWGPGMYFAERSQYSQGYSYDNSNLGTRSMLLCSVDLGYVKQMNNDNSIRQPPLLDEKNPGKGRYNAIGGYTGGSQIYILYGLDSKRAYPQYLIDYK